jgi:hypothetical protein
LTNNLNCALEASTESDPIEPEQSSTSRPEHATKSTAIPSTAAILAFFGWNVFRPGSPDPVEEQGRTVESAKHNAIVPDVLRCKICDRKIGLWAFRQTSSRSGKGGAPTQKALDVVLEHREFCPIRTLSGKSLDKEGHDAWWTDAAILVETPMHQSHADERIDQRNADNEENEGISYGMEPDDRNGLGSVVAVLKTFIG